MCDWSSRLQEARSTERSLLVGQEQHKAALVLGKWGRRVIRSLAAGLSCSHCPLPADGERPLPSHTGLVSVNCVMLFVTESVFPELYSLQKTYAKNLQVTTC